MPAAGCSKGVNHVARYQGHCIVADGDQIPGYVYHDISVSYDFPEMGPVKGTRLVLGINNLFDKDPPFLTGDAIGKSNSILGPYDTTGRLFYTRFSIKL